MIPERSLGHFDIRTWPHRHIIPNAITFLGLFLGFQAIIFAFRGDYVSAAWFCWIASVVDLSDGPVARALNAGSPMGKLFDSFADLINFGLAPSLIIYLAFLEDWGFWGLALSFGLLAGVVTRLARFSVMASHRPDYFSGLPVSMATGLLTAYVVFCDYAWGQYRYPMLVVVAIPVLCWLMLGNLRYPKSFFISPKRIFRTWQGWCGLGIIMSVALVPAWLIIVPLAFDLGMTILGIFWPKITKS